MQKIEAMIQGHNDHDQTADNVNRMDTFFHLFKFERIQINCKSVKS